MTTNPTRELIEEIETAHWRWIRRWKYGGAESFKDDLRPILTPERIAALAWGEMNDEERTYCATSPRGLYRPFFCKMLKGDGEHG